MVIAEVLGKIQQFKYKIQTENVILCDRGQKKMPQISYQWRTDMFPSIDRHLIHNAFHHLFSSPELFSLNRKRHRDQDEYFCHQLWPGVWHRDGELI